MGEDATLADCFKSADDVLHNACAGIAEIINVDGIVNVDFEDVKTVMSEQGKAMMGTATGIRRWIARASRPSRPSRARCWKASTCPARAACWSTSPLAVAEDEGDARDDGHDPCFAADDAR